MYHKAAMRYPQILTIALTSFQEYSQLRMNNSRKKPQSKSKAPAKKAKRPQKQATKKSRPRPYGFLVKKDGTLETKEERDNRLAKREALLLRAFQMAYDNHHNNV
jgi:hypothetical protein